MDGVETRLIASLRPSIRIIIVDKDWVETRLIASLRNALPKCIAAMQCRYAMPLCNAAMQCRYAMPLCNAEMQCRNAMPKCIADMHGKYLCAILQPIKLDNNWQIMMKYGKISK